MKSKKGSGPKPDSVKAHPDVERRLGEMIQNDQIDSHTTFAEVWNNNPDFHAVAKEKFRRFFNTMKKNAF